MKDKEKQIEEMAKIIKDNSIIDVTYGGKPYADDYENLARKLLEHYQPKLPKDSVVLSMTEYKKLKMLEKGHITCEDVLEFVEKARKETAEKCIRLIKETYFTKEALCEFISKQFGVEIGE